MGPSRGAPWGKAPAACWRDRLAPQVGDPGPSMSGGTCCSLRGLCRVPRAPRAAQRAGRGWRHRRARRPRRPLRPRGRRGGRTDRRLRGAAWVWRPSSASPALPPAVSWPWRGGSETRSISSVKCCEGTSNVTQVKTSFTHSSHSSQGASLEWVQHIIYYI